MSDPRPVPPQVPSVPKQREAPPKDGRIRRQMLTVFNDRCPHGFNCICGAEAISPKDPDCKCEFKCPDLTADRQRECELCMITLHDCLFELTLLKRLHHLYVNFEVCPTTNRCHLQCYIVTKDHHGWPPSTWRKRLDELLIGGYNLTACAGSDYECIRYCTKDYDGGFGRFTSFGVPFVDPGQREKHDWEDTWASAKAGRFEDIDAKVRTNRFSVLKAISNHYAASVYVAPLPAPPSAHNIWLWGDSGIGKSWEASEYYRTPAGVALPCYYKDTTQWWDGYSSEPVVIIEDVDPNTFAARGPNGLDRLLKIWADLRGFPAQVKGGCGKIRPAHIIVTSQYPIDACFPDLTTRAAIERRFTEINVTVPYINRRDTEIMSQQDD